MFKKDFERTPQERARRAQFSIIARLGGCGYLIYIMVQLLQTPAESRTTLMVVLAVILLAASAAVIVLTVYDLIRALKTGRFNPAMYEDMENGCAEPSELEEPGDGSDASDTASLEAHDDDASDDDGEDE